MVSSIESTQLTIKVSSTGAELQNIVSKGAGTEYLWQGDSEHWARRSPVLFPFVGALKEKSYFYDGKKYEMSQHGFARNREFELVESSSDALKYRLTATEETKKSYPFDFQLDISYRVIEAKLIVSYEVSNLSLNEDLWFSIGAHPAFNCPSNENEKRSDYSILFSQLEKAERQLIDGGTRTGEKIEVLNNENHLAITDELFNQDALIFDSLKSNEVSIAKGDKPIVTMNFEGFPYLGIWSKSNKSPFVCLEPWFGIADHIDHNQQLTDKEGISSLKPSETFSCSLAITFF